MQINIAIILLAIIVTIVLFIICENKKDEYKGVILYEKQKRKSKMQMRMRNGLKQYRSKRGG